jgi:hypothetical protein
MASSIIHGNATYRDRIVFLNIVLPADSVLNEQVGTGSPIAADKIEHNQRANYSQESATTSVSESRVIHTVNGLTGTLKAFKAGCVVANVGAATITVDLLKNGVSVLSAPVALDSTQIAYELEVDTIVDATAAVGDVFEVAVVAAAGGGTIGLGVFAYLDLYEDAA